MKGGAPRARAYPGQPGWKEEHVSRPNAIFNKAVFNRMQKRVLALYESGFEGTADDAAAKLGITPFSARPRCTELVKLGLLEKFRIDRSIPGRSAWQLRLADPQARLGL